MLRYVLTSEREEPMLIDGFGLLDAGERREVSEAEAWAFQNSRGLSFVRAMIPTGVVVEVEIHSGSKEVGE